MAIAFICMMVFASTASAQTTIYGCLDKVYINKDKNPVHQNDVSPALNTTLTPNGDGSYKLVLSEFKVGKMPAKLEYTVKSVDAKFLGVAFDTEVHFTTECTIK